MSAIRHLRGAAGLAAIGLLAACGGGGGNRPDPPASPPPAPPPPAQTYTLGGEVSGLAGAGLTLRNNAGAALVIEANGAFVFAEPLPAQSTYVITVGSQPVSPDQICTVTNGSGTLQANVTNVAVACSTNVYSVGGTVSGLSGSNLVLNNGREQFTVDANGSFAFPTPLLPGISYDVSVDNAPVKPTQRCVVRNGRGTVTASNVSGVTIACQTPYPSFAYALNRADGTMASFAVDAATGQLRPALVTKTGAAPVAAVTYQTTDGKQFRYVVNHDDDTVSAFALGVRDGDIVEAPGSPFATGDAGPTVASLHPTLPFLYVANQSGSSIAAFRIQANGSLTSAGLAATGAQPRWFVIEPNGLFAYAAGAGSAELYTYAIDQTNGALTEAPASRIALGGSSGGLVLERQGRYLYAFDSTAGSISAFAIDAMSGIPAPIAGSPFAAGANATLAALHPNGRFMYVKHPASAHPGGGLTVFVIDSASGALTKATGSPFDSSSNPVTVRFDPTGRYLYAAHAAGGSAFDLRAYAVNTATGALTAVPGSPFATPSSPTDLAIDASGNFVYVTHESSNLLSSYRIHPETGALSVLPTSPAIVGAMPGFIGSEDQPAPLSFVSRAAYVTDGFLERLHRLEVGSRGLLGFLDTQPLNGAPQNVALDPLGRFLYVPGPLSGDVGAFSVHAGTGALTGLPASPFAAAAGATSIRFEPQGRFAYVTSPTTNTIQRYEVDRATGALSSPSSIATPGEAYGVTIHPNGKFLYASAPVNSGGMIRQHVRTYEIAPDTGMLTPTNTNDSVGEALAVLLDPSGRYAYINDPGSPGVRAYSIDSQDGSLTPLANDFVHVFSPYGLAMDPAGRFVFVTRRDHNTVEVFTIQPEGSLSLAGSYGVGGEPIAAAVDASGRWLYVTQLGGRSVVTFDIDRASGALALKQITSTLWQMPFVRSPLTLSSYIQ